MFIPATIYNIAVKSKRGSEHYQLTRYITFRGYLTVLHIFIAGC